MSFSIGLYRDFVRKQVSLAETLKEREIQPPILHGTKRSRQAVGAATGVSMKHHGWKQTGERSSLWAFERRWPHLRDHAEGRNHRLPSE